MQQIKKPIISKENRFYYALLKLVTLHNAYSYNKFRPLVLTANHLTRELFFVALLIMFSFLSVTAQQEIKDSTVINDNLVKSIIQNLKNLLQILTYL